jgi:hypothetical protein
MWATSWMTHSTLYCLKQRPLKEEQAMDDDRLKGKRRLTQQVAGCVTTSTCR